MMRDRASLLDAITEIERLPRTAERRLVLAEAEFRLAVASGVAAEEAIERLDRAIAYDPFAAKLHLHLGRALHRDGRHRAALVAYRQAARLAPGSRRVRLLLALALLDLGKPERELGQRILDALSGDEPGVCTAVLADLDALLAGKAAAAGNRKASGVRAGRDAAADAWRPALIAQLSLPTPAGKKVAAQLEMGRSRLVVDGLASYATACVLMLIGGEAVNAVRQLMTGAGLDRQPNHPAVAVLRTALELAEIEDPAGLVEAISRRIEQRLVPPELACWMHFARHLDAPPQVLVAMRLLDAYPRWIGALDCFVELRIAILDDYARRAWAEKRFDAARLLWHEIRALDPHRVPVAGNLALLAARTRATDEYRPAWDRFTEVLYLHSAGVGDVQLYLDDRVTLHLALSQQSANRPRTGGMVDDLPTEGELAAWIADPDAVEVWLREWDLYYLNSRLRFRSAINLLGVPRDADAEALAEAHDAFVRHLDCALAGLRWTGVEVFRDLAKARAQEALKEALLGVERGTDPYYELENASAEALTEELLRRVRLLRWLSRFLAHQKSAAVLALGGSVAMRQFALPSGPLQRLCVDRGLIGRDETLVDAFAADLVEIAAGWEHPPPEGERQCAERLAALDRCVEAAPHLVAVRAHRCRLLHRVGRHDDAYAAAVEAVSLPPAGSSTEEVECQRADLVTLIDDIGEAALPDEVRRRRLPADPAPALRAARQVVRRYPHSGAARLALVDLLVLVGRNAEASALLRDGAALALTGQQRVRFESRRASMQFR